MRHLPTLAILAALAGCSTPQPRQAGSGGYTVQFRDVSANSKDVFVWSFERKICGAKDTREFEFGTVTVECLLGDYGFPSVMLTTSKWKESRTEPLPKYKGQSVYGQFPLFTNGDNVDKLYYEVTAN